VHAAALAVAAAACVTDIRSRRIPNALTFSALAVALIVHGLLPQGLGWSHVTFGALVGLAVFLPFFMLGGMGAGDVKLMMALGAWLGAGTILRVALYGAVAGGVLAVAVAYAHGYLKQALSNLWCVLRYWRAVGVRPVPELTLEVETGPRLAYAVPIFVGLVVTLWRS
jgi:prepilin peptidase CpaA